MVGLRCTATKAVFVASPCPCCHLPGEAETADIMRRFSTKVATDQQALFKVRNAHANPRRSGCVACVGMCVCVCGGAVFAHKSRTVNRVIMRASE